MNFIRPDRFSPEEWEARVQLAAAYRIFDHLGWTELIYNHISLRVPGEPSHYPDQPVRPALLRGLRLEPGQGRSRGQHRRPLRLADQPGRHHLPRRDPRHAARRALRDAPAHDGDAGGLLPEGRPRLHQLLRRAALRQGGVPRLRRHHRPCRRRRAHPAQRRGPARAAAAQPRAGDDRPHPAAGAAADVDREPRLRGPAGDAGQGRGDRRSPARCSRSASPTRSSSTRSTAPARTRSPRCSGWSTARTRATGCRRRGASAARASGLGAGGDEQLLDLPRRSMRARRAACRPRTPAPACR